MHKPLAGLAGRSIRTNPFWELYYYQFFIMCLVILTHYIQPVCSITFFICKEKETNLLINFQIMLELTRYIGVEFSLVLIWRLKQQCTYSLVEFKKKKCQQFFVFVSSFIFFPFPNSPNNNNNNHYT
jgi:hypothetical protein